MPEPDDPRSLNEYPFSNLIEDHPPITSSRLVQFIAGVLGLVVFFAFLMMFL